MHSAYSCRLLHEQKTAPGQASRAARACRRHRRGSAGQAPAWGRRGRRRARTPLTWMGFGVKQLRQCQGLATARLSQPPREGLLGRGLDLRGRVPLYGSGVEPVGCGHDPKDESHSCAR
jgi:hypothetical protein